MNNPINKIQQMTSRGQVTLPIDWRNKFDNNQILIQSRGDILEISSFNIDKKSCAHDYTVFDAIRDNNGKGIKATDLVKMLKKIDS